MAKKRATGKSSSRQINDDTADQYFMRGGQAYVRSGKSGDVFGPYDKNTRAGQTARGVPAPRSGNSLGRPTPPKTKTNPRNTPPQTRPNQPKRPMPPQLAPEPPKRGPRPGSPLMPPKPGSQSPRQLPKPGPVPPPAPRVKDALSGLTHEYGTKSLLKGALKFFR